MLINFTIIIPLGVLKLAIIVVQTKDVITWRSPGSQEKKPDHISAVELFGVPVIATIKLNIRWYRPVI